MNLRRPTLRRRVALWCAGLVVVTGTAVVLLVVVASGVLLHDRARQADRQLGERAPSAGTASGPGVGAPDPPGAGTASGPRRPDGPTPLEVARRDGAQETLRDVRLLGLVAVGGLALVAVGASWAVAGHLVRPLAKVTDTARSISRDSRLDRRIGHHGAGDEIDELAGSFDAMLDRLEAVFDAQRAFVSTTSHELRTPLAAMRAEVDVALDDPGADADDLRRALGAIGEELEHTTGLVASMLALARAEAIADPQPCDLAEAAERALDLVGEAWRSAHDVQVALAPAVVDGDPVLLAQMAANLVGNACKYDREGGLLRVVVGSEGDDAVLLVENDGPVVDPATVGSLFARFVRRSEHGEGHGLGLAIVHTIVATHGGRISAAARPQGGLRVEVRLPRRRD
ncbi:MAG: HAMP domain-containing sensor histidine kinase [Acidimicrobiales bacterium]